MESNIYLNKYTDIKEQEDKINLDKQQLQNEINKQEKEIANNSLPVNLIMQKTTAKIKVFKNKLPTLEVPLTTLLQNLNSFQTDCPQKCIVYDGELIGRQLCGKGNLTQMDGEIIRKTYQGELCFGTKHGLGELTIKSEKGQSQLSCIWKNDVPEEMLTMTIKIAFKESSNILEFIFNGGKISKTNCKALEYVSELKKNQQSVLLDFIQSILVRRFNEEEIETNVENTIDSSKHKYSAFIKDSMSQEKPLLEKKIKLHSIAVEKVGVTPSEHKTAFNPITTDSNKQSTNIIKENRYNLPDKPKQSWRRILKEQNKIASECTDGTITLDFNPEDLDHCRAFLKVTNVNSPQFNGVFTVKLDFPSDQPFKPPKVKILNKIFHPNIILETNTPNLGILSDQWSPAINSHKILLLTLELLNEPNQDEMIVGKVQELIDQNEEAFVSKAREMTSRYAYEEIY